MAKSPFRIELYSDVYGDRRAGVPTNGADLGPVANPISVSATFRRNGLGSVQIVVAPGDPINDLLMEDGTFADVFYRDRREMTGKIRTRQGSFTPTGNRTYWIRDDRGILDDTLAWVKPMHGNVAAQIGPLSLGDDGQWWGTVPLQGTGDLTGAVGYYDWTNGELPSIDGVQPKPFDGLPTSTEDAIRKLYFENLYRRNGALPPGLYRNSGHRGLLISSVADLPQVRFGKLSDYINPMADAAGLIVRVLREHGEYLQDDPITPQFWGEGGAFLLEITEPREWPAALTAESGVVVEPSTWVLTDPTVTRAVVAGQGDLAARVLKQYPSQHDLGLLGWMSADEDRIQWISEIFRDATGTAPTWPASVPDLLKVAAYFEFRPEPLPADVATFLNALDAAGADALGAGAPTSGLSITLAETPGFHYGGDDGIWLGDITTLRDPSGLEFTDSLSEVTIAYDDSGTKVTPKIGNRQDDPTRQIYDRIAALAAAQRKLSTSK